MKRSNLINEKLIASIICVAYGDAGIAEKIKVYFYSLINPRVKELLEEYRETAGAVHSYKKVECPAVVIQTVRNKIYKYEKAARRKNSFTGVLFARPLVTTASAFVIIAVISFFVLKKQPAEKQYSKAEVIKAEEQVKQSLAIVGKVFKRTENRLTEDVLEKQVAPPFKKSFDTINNLLNGG